ncbi:MAG: ABC transporter ATP-binding protein [Acholeplasmataceae bacterium]|jgi:ATP-binding cassette subfamily B protein|nr:ABC transporter ATP-binding protein [Acholeplasmataceae bacterium]
MLRLMKSFKWYHWFLILVIIGLIYGQVQMDLALPEYMGNIIVLISQGVQTGISPTSDILKEGAMMLLVTIGSITATIIASLIAARLGTRLAVETRSKLFKHIQGFSTAEIQHFSTPSLITRSTNDIQQVQMAVIMMLRLLITAPIMAFSGIRKVTSINLSMSLVVVGGVVAILTLIAVIFTLVVPKFSKIQTQVDDVNQVTRETLTGIRVVRAHHAERIQKDKFEVVNVNLTKTQLFVNRAFAILNPGMNFIMNGLNLALITLGAVLIGDGLLGANPIEGLSLQVQFTSYAMIILIGFMMLIMLFIFLPRAWVSAKRINEVLDTPYSIDESEKMLIPSTFDVKVEFKNVSFRYPKADEDVLKNISFTAKKGETLAFIGSTGSGKSTIISLLLRFYDVTSGEILINGINIKKYPLDELYQLMGYVPQKGTLFRGDIASNLYMGNQGVTEEDMMKALEVAQIKSITEESDEGMHRSIDQGGANVSGGQKQRLSIARAVVKKPKIYLFDDSFSALDYRTDQTLRKALKPIIKNALTIIIGQRIGTIMDAEQIVVLDQGEIVGIGTHQSLLETCQAYQEIAFAQVSKEELGYV